LTPNRFSKIFIIVLNIHIITDLITFASSIAQAASQVAAATPSVLLVLCLGRRVSALLLLLLFPVLLQIGLVSVGVFNKRKVFF
jgi:hypothetical protein